LLLYGENDRLAEGGRRFAADYESAGGHVVLSMTQNVGHGFFNLPPHLGETTRVVDDFLRSLGWLGVTPDVPLPNASAVLAEEPNNPERAPTIGDRPMNGR
jgi:acetyl esterase/lipase